MNRNEKERLKRHALKVDQCKLLVAEVVFQLQENDNPMDEKITNIAEMLATRYNIKRKV